MLERFYPHEYAESVFSIDYGRLYGLGYRGLIFDIDNTLVHHGDDATPEVEALFAKIQGMGFTTLLLSNNDEKRIQRFIKNIDTLYICDADKPNTSGYLRAAEMMNVGREKTVFIGDQIFTDILGANRSKIACILVKYIRGKEDSRPGKRRALEGVILKFYKKSKRYKAGLGGIRKKGDI